MIEADVKYPTDAGLASSGVRVLAREGRKLARLIKQEEGAGAGSLAGDGSQAAERSPHDPPPRGRGQAGILELTGETGECSSVDQGGAPLGCDRERERVGGARGEVQGRRQLGVDGGSLKKVAATSIGGSPTN